LQLNTFNIGTKTVRIDEISVSLRPIFGFLSYLGE